MFRLVGPADTDFVSRHRGVTRGIGISIADATASEVFRHLSEPISVSEPLGHDPDAEIGGLIEDQQAIAPFDAAATALLPLEVAQLVVGLDDRERDILRLRFGLDRCGAANPR